MAPNSMRDALDILRDRFDERLASLKAEDASDRLRALMGHGNAGSGKYGL